MFALLSVTLCAGCAKNDAPAIVAIDDRSLICMVTDLYMGQPQIPVEVENRRYYGCCQNCIAKLQDQPAIRQATDPVTGRHVDKAQAFAGRLADGRVLYFESAETLAGFRP